MPTFLYTDIEGSTQLWEKHGQAMGAVLDRHDQILMECVQQWGGEHVKNTGDGMMVVFHDQDAWPLECALTMQRRLAAVDIPGRLAIEERVFLELDAHRFPPAVDFRFGI